MQSYKIPSAADLLNRTTAVRKRYLEQPQHRSAENRLYLISCLEALSASLKEVDQEELGMTSTEFQDLCYAAWLFCFSSIEVNQRNLESLGLLYQILSDTFGPTELKAVDTFDKLRYLTKLYQFVSTHQEIFLENFTQHKITQKAFCEFLLSVMSRLLQTIEVKKERCLHAIPDEIALTKSMECFSEKYDAYLLKQEKEHYIYFSHNPYYKKIAQLITSLSKVLMPNDAESKQSLLSRNERIKMGAILYAMRLTYYSYYIRSALNSGLYTLCYDAFNQNTIDNIDPELQQACLAAFYHFLNDEAHLVELEKSMDIGYIDRFILSVQREILDMLTCLDKKPTPLSRSTVLLSTATLGGIIASAPGYGVGYTIGYIASEMNSTVNTKILVSQLTGKVMTVIFGKSGQCMGYFVSNMVVDIALERSFAKVFELLGIVLGAGIGASIGFVIHEVSYKTLYDLCQCLFWLRTQLDPNLARDIEPRIIDCLLNLPEEIFKKEQKNKLRAITRGGFFTETQQPSSPSSKKITGDIDVENDILIQNEDDTDESDEALVHLPLFASASIR